MAKIRGYRKGLQPRYYGHEKIFHSPHEVFNWDSPDKKNVSLHKLWEKSIDQKYATSGHSGLVFREVSTKGFTFQRYFLGFIQVGIRFRLVLRIAQHGFWAGEYLYVRTC